MRYAREDIERYRSRLKSVSGDARSYVRAMVAFECDGLEVADARETAKAIVAAAVDAFGSTAQSYACDFFDEFCEAEGIDVRASIRHGLTDPADIDAKVRFYARRLADGDLEGFADDCAERAAFYVFREANECMVANVLG